MIGYENKDSSFFALEVGNIAVPGVQGIGNPPSAFVNKNVKSFTVVEEMGKMKQGSIVFDDPDNIFSSLFKTGVNFTLTWGYRKFADMNVVDAVRVAKSAAVGIGGAGVRVMKGFFMSPSGGGQNDGKIDYTATFYGEEYAAAPSEKLYSMGVRGDSIRDALGECGVLTTNIFMDWDRAKEPLTHPIRKYGKPYEWLQKKALESKIFFDLGYDVSRQKIACWVDTYKVDSAVMRTYNRRMAGAITPESFARFGYRLLNSSFAFMNDAESFTWSQNVGENGTGDNIQLFYQPNGKVTFFRSVAGSKQVSAYELDPEAIKKYQLALDKTGNLTSGTLDLLTRDFNTYVKLGFFVEKKFSTSPEGFGFKANVSLKTGNPALYPGQVCKFHGAFPNPFKDEGNTFYLHRLDHEYLGGRYTQRVEIADCFTITGGSLIGAFKGVD